MRTLTGLLVAFGLAALSGGTHALDLPPGTLDPDFGMGTPVVSDLGSNFDQIFALAPLNDRRLLAAGVMRGSNVGGVGISPNMAVVRYLANGIVDAGFGNAGLVSLDIAGASDEVRAIKVLSDGGILLAGTISTNSYADFGLVKLDADGNLDHSFGEGSGVSRAGYVRLDIGGAFDHDQAYAMAVQSNGRIVVAGITPVLHGNGFKYSQVSVARFTANGELDTSFGGSGTGYAILPPFYGDASDSLTGIALDPTGNLPAGNRITVVGYTNARNTAFIARLTADGATDTGFGEAVGGGLRSGRVLLHAAQSGGTHTGLSYLSAARLTSDGRIVVAGQGGDRGITLMRFLSNGTLDTGFAVAGRVTIKYSGSGDYDEPNALAIQGNGKLVASGYATSRATGVPRDDFYVVRLLATGAVDTGFGDGQGRVVVAVSSADDGSYALEVDPLGGLLVGGYAQQAAAGSTQQWDFALLRLIGDVERSIFADAFEDPM